MIPDPEIKGREFVEFHDIRLDCGVLLCRGLGMFNNAGPHDDDLKGWPEEWDCPQDCREACTFPGRSDRASSSQDWPDVFGWAVVALLLLGALCAFLSSTPWR